MRQKYKQNCKKKKVVKLKIHQIKFIYRPNNFFEQIKHHIQKFIDYFINVCHNVNIIYDYLFTYYHA